MYILGLTGPIASGKSTVAKFFMEEGIPVLNADEIIHELQQPASAVCIEIIKHFGFQFLSKDGSVDRKKLGAHLVNNPGGLKFLEQLLHPLLRQEMRFRLDRLANDHAKLVVIEVPLMFKSGFDKLCDSVVTTISPVNIRKERAFKRNPSMTEEKWAFFTSHQLSNEEYMEKSHHIIQTDKSLDEVKLDVKNMIQSCAKQKRKVWPHNWLLHFPETSQS